MDILKSNRLSQTFLQLQEVKNFLTTTRSKDFFIPFYIANYIYIVDWMIKQVYWVHALGTHDNATHTRTHECKITESEMNSEVLLVSESEFVTNAWSVRSYMFSTGARKVDEHSNPHKMYQRKLKEREKRSKDNLHFPLEEFYSVFLVMIILLPAPDVSVGASLEPVFLAELVHWILKCTQLLLD